MKCDKTLTASRLGIGVILIDLDLHTTSRGELRYNNRVGDLLKDRGICFTPEAIVKSMKVCGSDDELKMGGLYEKV